LAREPPGRGERYGARHPDGDDWPQVARVQRNGCLSQTHHANKHAAAHATIDKTSPSARSVRTIRTRDAPSDCRKAISRCRTRARETSRFATFAHTIRRVTSVTIWKMARKASPREATRLLPPAVAECATSMSLSFWFT
jgi:hypothetical protein